MKIENLLAKASERYSKREFGILKNLLYSMRESAKQWNRKLVKCEKGENLIYDALIDVGYNIATFPYEEEGIISLERKIQKSKEPRFPDAFAMYVGEGDPSFESWFFLDPKFKSSSQYLGVVNVNDYDGYWKFLRYGKIQAPFKIFFYINDMKGIYVHNLRNPKRKPTLESTIEILRGKPIYKIYRSEIKFWKRTD